MSKNKCADDYVNRILEENGITINKSFAVEYKDDTSIRLLVHMTRDNVILTIHKGDRKR